MNQGEMKTITDYQMQKFQIWEGSPIGQFFIATTPKGICAVKIIPPSVMDKILEGQSKSMSDKNSEFLSTAIQQLEEYFQGKRTEFILPLDLSRVSLFSQKVLEEARKIKFGQVCSYGDIGVRIGRPNTARAVGMALANNPLMLVIPCHRVIAKDQHLHGYSAPQGLATKAWLLQFEGHLIENMKVIR